LRRNFVKPIPETAGGRPNPRAKPYDPKFRIQGAIEPFQDGFRLGFTIIYMRFCVI
jgi:hypothetical protein